MLAQWWGKFLGRREERMSCCRVKEILESAQAKWVKVPTRSNVSGGEGMTAA